MNTKRTAKAIAGVFIFLIRLVRFRFINSKVSESIYMKQVSSAIWLLYLALLLNPTCRINLCRTDHRASRPAIRKPISNQRLPARLPIRKLSWICKSQQGSKWNREWLRQFIQIRSPRDRLQFSSQLKDQICPVQVIHYAALKWFLFELISQ